MINLYETGAYLLNGTELVADNADAAACLKSKGIETTRGSFKKYHGLWNFGKA